MSRPRNGRDYAGMVAVILAVTFAVVLLVTVAVEVFTDNEPLGEAAQRLLNTIVAGLLGVLSIYIGREIRRNGKRNGGGPPP